MRIFHIDPDDIENPVSGGGPIRTFEIYRRLSQRHQITVLTPNFPGSTKEKMKEGVRYIRVGKRYGNHNSTYYMSFYFQAPFVARSFSSDLFVEDLMPPCAATLTPLLNKRKTIASVQWFFAREWAKQYKFPFHWYQPLGLKFYKYFIVLTEDMKAQVLRYNPKARITVIPNGVHEAFFTTSPSEDNFILYLGRIDIAQKGVDLLIGAFSKIAERTEVNLVIAGDGMDREKIQADVARHNLSSRILFLGKVDTEKKKELLSKCLFVAMPSRYETFGMVALEAFASNKPVVCFSIPHLRSIVRKSCAVIVEHCSVDEYAQALLFLLQDHGVRHEFGKNAREYARTLQWDTLALAQEAFYLNCIKN